MNTFTNPQICLISPEKQWTLSFSATRQQNQQSNQRKMVMRVLDNGKMTISVHIENHTLSVILQPYEKDSPLTIKTDLSTQANDIQIVWRGYQVELWNNKELVDEEWPIGSCFHTNESNVPTAQTTLEILSEQITSFSFSNTTPPELNKTTSLKDAQYWSPKQGIENVGDCMPFYDGENFHLYYLIDRNGHQSKWHLGAHQYAHISSDDLKTWTSHPTAIPITHQWEGSICTGCIIKANDIYYAFYAVRMSDGTSAKISYATSTDSIHFTKSEHYFGLHHPYETTSVRDPEVFLGEDGQYHMLITSSWADTDIKERNGCLAHLTSTNLITWTEHPPFLIPGYTDQPECCNYFSWNGWYYLIFSNYGAAKYRYSKNQFGPWEKPTNETIGSQLYRVPKTAEFKNNRRITVGFLPNAVNGNSYAGNAVFYELVQHADGTLGTKAIPEMLACLESLQNVSLKPDPTTPYQQKICKKFNGNFTFSSKIFTESPQTTYGFSLHFCESGAQYEIRFEPFNRKIVVSPLHSNPFDQSSNFSLYNVENLDKQTQVQIVFHNGILNVYVNNDRALVCRLDNTFPSDCCQVGCFSTGCTHW